MLDNLKKQIGKVDLQLKNQLLLQLFENQYKLFEKDHKHKLFEKNTVLLELLSIHDNMLLRLKWQQIELYQNN